MGGGVGEDLVEGLEEFRGEDLVEGLEEYREE